MKTNLFVCIFAGFFLCLGLLVPASYADTTVLLNTVDVQRYASDPADNLVGNKKAVPDPVEGRGHENIKGEGIRIIGGGAKQNGLEVRLEIYSGRPNPVFFISDEKELKQLQDLISGLEKYDQRDYVSRYENPKMGYNGFYIRVIGQPEIFSGIYDEIIVFKNHIEIPSSKRIRYGEKREKEVRFDRNRAVEDFLFKLAVDRNLITAKGAEFYKNSK